MTVMKDDGDDHNSRVPNKTDDQRLYDSRYILYHSNVVDRKNHKKQTTNFCMILFRSKNRCFRRVVNLSFAMKLRFVSKTEGKEARKFFRGILKELEFTVFFK